MITDARGVSSVPFEQFNCQIKNLRNPVQLAEGTSNGTAVRVPVAGTTRVAAIQKVGTVAGSGVVAGSIQESANGTDWTTVYTFTAGATLGDTQLAFFNITQTYVRHVAVVTGGGAGTAITSCDLLY